MDLFKDNIGICWCQIIIINMLCLTSRLTLLLKTLKNSFKTYFKNIIWYKAEVAWIFMGAVSEHINV